LIKIKYGINLLISILLVLLIFSGCDFSLNTAATQTSDSERLKAPEPKPAEGQFVFRLADNLSDGYPSVAGDREFARMVEERSKGRLKIIVYNNAVLGDEKSVIEQVQLGGIDFARVNSAPLVSASSKLSVLSLPYLFRDSNHLWSVLLGPIGDELLDSLKDGGINGLAYYDSGARSFYIKRPVSRISDLKGLRIRVQQSQTFEDFIILLGAEPVPLSFGEVYNSLQKDEIDGAENNWSSYYLTNHYKIAKYYILDEHTRNPEIVIASSKVMNKLTQEDRDIITLSAKDSVEFQRNAWKETEKKSEQNIRNSGVTVIRLDSSEKEQLAQAIIPLYEEYGKEYKDLIESIQNTK
jgi:tripartite ATP-independent transporter DctP family solute receptor